MVELEKVMRRYFIAAFSGVWDKIQRRPVGQYPLCFGGIYCSASTCRILCDKLTITLTTWGIDGVPQLSVLPLAQLVLLGPGSGLGGLDLWTSDTGNRQEGRRKSATKPHSSELWDTGRAGLFASVWVKKDLQVMCSINSRRGTWWVEFTEYKW